MELRAGGTLGRYQLLVRIGRGGMASVWVARERTRTSERLVAVKAMLPELAEKPHFRSMFLDEGQIARSIDHANVVSIYEVSEDRGVLYMAMEWVEGDSLRVLIQEAKKRRAIPPEMAVRIIADTAAGLHAAHELRGWDGELRGIVHCDVSPHNILVGVDGRAKLVDFGVASAVEHLRALEEGDRVAGKFAYMSPEQASAKPVDRRSDVFSLGVVLFELTTGERLFKADDPARTLDLVKRAQIPRPTELNPKYPAGLEAIVLRALDRDVNRRFANADELRHALDRFLVEERVLVSPASVAQLLKRVVGARIEKRRQLIRAVLQSLDGELRPGLLTEDSALASSAHSAVTDTSLNTSLSAMGMTGVSAIDAVNTPSSRPSLSGSAAVQVLERRATRRSPSTWLIGGGALLAAALTGYAIQRAASHGAPAEPTPTAAAPAARAPRAAEPAPTPPPQTGAISIDSLPVASAEERAARSPARAAPRAPSAPPAWAAPPAEPAPSAAAPEPEAAPADSEPANEHVEPARPEVPEPAPPPREPSAPAGPLNQGAALAALGSAASSARSCRGSDGPHGSGQATVTFQPSGSVSSVAVSSPFAGTQAGACVVKAFKRVRLPAFTGSAVTLTRSFTVPE